MLTRMTRVTRQDAGPAVVPGQAKAAGWLAPRTVAIAAVVGLTLLGCTARVLAARGELWIDEIWSLTLVAGLTSPDQVFWDLPHDNNHILNSLWLYLAGPDRAPIVYRVPAIAFGTTSILVDSRSRRFSTTPPSIAVSRRSGLRTIRTNSAATRRHGTFTTAMKGCRCGCRSAPQPATFLMLKRPTFRLRICPAAT